MEGLKGFLFKGILFLSALILCRSQHDAQHHASAAFAVASTGCGAFFLGRSPREGRPFTSVSSTPPPFTSLACSSASAASTVLLDCLEQTHETSQGTRVQRRSAN